MGSDAVAADNVNTDRPTNADAGLTSEDSHADAGFGDSVDMIDVIDNEDGVADGLGGDNGGDGGGDGGGDF